MPVLNTQFFTPPPAEFKKIRAQVLLKYSEQYKHITKGTQRIYFDFNQFLIFTLF
jgi:hypothetical protein